MTVNKDIIKSYRFKILPTIEQKESFSQWFGCRRFIYNKFASIQIKRHENGEKYLSIKKNTIQNIQSPFPLIKVKVKKLEKPFLQLALFTTIKWIKKQEFAICKFQK